MAAAAEEVLTTGKAARRLGVDCWQVARVYEKGLVPEPGRVGMFRVIRASDLPAVERALRQLGYLPAEGKAP